MTSMAPSVRAESKRRYQHFCPAARALETIGERWSLLIVRDLLAGPRRFSDLRRSLAAITPKGLSARLRALEAAGIVAREVASEREVWYRLTPKGGAGAGLRRAARLGDGSRSGTPARPGSHSSRADDGRDGAIPRAPPTAGPGSPDLGVPLRRRSQLHHSLRRRPLDTTARRGPGRRHRADVAGRVGELFERGRRGPTALAADTARQGNEAATRRIGDRFWGRTLRVGPRPSGKGGVRGRFRNGGSV